MTTLVVVIVAILSAYHLSTLSAFLLEETSSRAELLSRALLQRAHHVVRESSGNPYEALQQDGGIRSILQSSIAYSAHVTYAAIVDPQGIAIAHGFPTREGSPVPEQEEFEPIVAATLRGDPQYFIDSPIALAGRPDVPVGYFFTKTHNF